VWCHKEGVYHCLMDGSHLLRLLCLRHSFKNWTGDQTSEDVGSGFYWSNHWFTGSLSGFLIYKVIYILLYNVEKTNNYAFKTCNLA
jgi:hypothetical protein